MEKSIGKKKNRKNLCNFYLCITIAENTRTHSSCSNSVSFGHMYSYLYIKFYEKKNSQLFCGPSW